MSRRQKRVVFYSSPLIVLLVIVLLAKLKLDQIEANAQQLAQMGQTAQKLLGEFRAGVEKFDNSGSNNSTSPWSTLKSGIAFFRISYAARRISRLLR